MNARPRRRPARSTTSTSPRFREKITGYYNENQNALAKLRPGQSADLFGPTAAPRTGKVGRVEDVIHVKVSDIQFSNAKVRVFKTAKGKIHVYDIFPHY